MATDSFKNLPAVQFSVDDGDFAKVKATAQRLAEMGMPEALQEYEREYRRAQAASKIFIRNAAAEEVEAAQDLERSLVGHSKSGYKPTGTLQGSITPVFNQDGKSVQIVPLATAEDAEKARQKIKSGAKTVKHVHKISKNEDAYYYGTAVEFGLGHNPKEPFMKPSGEKVAKGLDAKFDETMRQALE